MKYTSIVLLLVILPTVALSQRLVSFYTTDSLKIYADLYLNNPARPYILLAHSPGSSRGEYSSVAQKFLNLNYNCLAIDLRNGDKIAYTENLTVKENTDKRSDAADKLRLDIQAAIRYLYAKNKQTVILAGSLVSGSLCMIEAKNNPRVMAALAFSPGEYYRPAFDVQSKLASYDKKICVLGTTEEKQFISALVDPVAQSLLTEIYHPADRGYRGASLLWESNSTSEKFWLDLLFFFNTLENN